MKRFRIIVICMLILLACTAFAQAASFGQPFGLSFIPEEGFTTILTDKYGKEYNANGVPDTDAFSSCKNIGSIASYEIFYNGESLLEIELNGVESEASTGFAQGSSQLSTKSGYYAISMSNIGTSGTEQAFLTGLTIGNIAKAQEKIIAAAKGNSLVNIQDFDFIDAEKQYYFGTDLGWEYGESDENLCWAGASSNILTFTGWAEKAGKSSTDWVFDYFTSRFDDEGGWYNAAFSYFFNGYNPMQGSDGAQVDSDIYGEEYLGELTKYPYENYYNKYILYRNPEKIIDVAKDLQNGCGAGLTIDLYQNDNQVGCHAITMWGYVYDTSKSGKDAWKALIISDSDSNETYGENRRTGVNQYTYLPLTSTTYRWYDTWSIAPYSSGNNWLIYSVETLAPYDESDNGEVNGTGNRFMYPDFAIDHFQMDTVSGICNDSTERNVFSNGDDLYIYSCIANNSDVSDYETPAVNLKVDIFNESGTRVMTKEKSYWGYYDDLAGCVEVNLGSSLSPGKYTAIASLSTDIAEANYTNNTRSFEFTILDTSKKKETLSFSLGSSGRYDTNVYLSSFSEDKNTSRYIVYTAYGEGSQLSSRTTFWYNEGDQAAYFNSFNVDTSTQSEEEYIYIRALKKPKAWGAAWTEYIVSEGKQQQYYLLSPTLPSGSEVKTYSPINVGDTKLSNNEKIKFNIGNWSNKSGTLDFTWELYAIGGNTYESQYYTLKTGSGNLAKGSRLKNNIEVSSFDSYTNKSDISDMEADDYSLYVEVYYKDASGKSVSDFMYLGQLPVISGKGSLPTIIAPSAKDISNFDINSVGISAKACVEIGSSVRLGIEYGRTKDNTTSEWGDYEWEDISYMVPCEVIGLYNLEPVTKYYYRVIAEVNGKQYEGGWSEFTTKNMTDTIALNQVKRGYLPKVSGDEDWQNYYAFTTGSEAGYYAIKGKSETGSSNFGLYLYDLYNEEHWKGSYGDGSVQTINVYLEANRTYYMGIDAYSEDWYSIEITKYQNNKTFNASFESSNIDNTSHTINANLKVTMPLGSDVEYGVKVKYNGKEHTSSWILNKADHNEEEWSFEIDIKPDTECTYWGFIKDLKTGTEYKTAEVTVPAWTFNYNAAFGSCIKTITLSAGEKKKYKVNPTGKDTEYIIYCTGKDATMKLWIDEEEGVGYWKEIPIHSGLTKNDATTITVHKGDTAYITLDAYVTGDYILHVEKDSNDDEEYAWDWIEETIKKIRENINQSTVGNQSLIELDVNCDGLVNETDIEALRQVDSVDKMYMKSKFFGDGYFVDMHNEEGWIEYKTSFYTDTDEDTKIDNSRVIMTAGSGTLSEVSSGNWKWETLDAVVGEHYLFHIDNDILYYIPVCISASDTPTVRKTLAYFNPEERITGIGRTISSGQYEFKLYDCNDNVITEDLVIPIGCGSVTRKQGTLGTWIWNPQGGTVGGYTITCVVDGITYISYLTVLQS